MVYRALLGAALMDVDDHSEAPLTPQERKQQRHLWWERCMREATEKGRKAQNEAWRLWIGTIWPIATTLAAAGIAAWGWLHGGKP